MTKTIFIDGAVGTTGLEIAERLSGREEFSLVQLPEADRKDPAARRAAINESDFVILCLPDDAAIEAVAMVDNDRTRIIDASTAHRSGVPRLWFESGSQASGGNEAPWRPDP